MERRVHQSVVVVVVGAEEAAHLPQFEQGEEVVGAEELDLHQCEMMEVEEAEVVQARSSAHAYSLLEVEEVRSAEVPLWEVVEAVEARV